MASPAATRKVEAAEKRAASANQSRKKALQAAKEARQYAADLLGQERARMLETPVYAAAGGIGVGVIEGLGLTATVPVLEVEVSYGLLPAIGLVAVGASMESRLAVEVGSGGLAGVGASIGRQIVEQFQS